MKKNETKVTNLVATKVAEQLEGIKNSKTTKASAPKAKKTKKELVKDAQEAATKFANAKLVETLSKNQNFQKRTGCQGSKGTTKTLYHRTGNLQSRS